MEEKEKTYWAYTSLSFKNGRLGTFIGYLISDYDFFDFVGYSELYPDDTILTTQRVTKEYCEKMKEFLKSKNK